LQGLGEEVDILTIDQTTRWGALGRPPFRDTGLDLPVTRVPFVLNRRIRLLSGKVSFALSDRAFCRRLLEHLRNRRPDVAHWHALVSHQDPMSQWKGSARVWTNHSSIFVQGVRRARARRAFLREALAADEIIAPSEELCALTEQLGVSRERVHFIPNGVDTSAYSPGVSAGAWRERLGLGPADRVVLCPRRLVRKNGVSFFVRAALDLLSGGLPDTLFVIAGDDGNEPRLSEAGAIEALVNSSPHGGRVRRLGRVEPRDLPSLYAASHVVVIPSLIEATSLSALEAMASARPVVATRVGGLPYLVRDGENGLLVEPADAGALATALKALLQDPDRARRLGEAGRQRVEAEFDWKTIAHRTLEVYRRALRHV
jgi:glycosyltransferase involved in cell wall biosynthesis